nr:hypothetical protein Q903MT_gene2121 [Picea sitchensis]
MAWHRADTGRHSFAPRSPIDKGPVIKTKCILLPLVDPVEEILNLLSPFQIEEQETKDWFNNHNYIYNE